MQTSAFHDSLIAQRPKLLTRALALTRNRAMAEDLVQSAMLSALRAQASFMPGTNFDAWTYRILRNRFLSEVRRRRNVVDLDAVPESMTTRPAGQEHALELQELARTLDRLPTEQREALLMLILNDMSFEDIAAATHVPPGTAKSRVFRARRQLEAWLLPPKEARADAGVDLS